MISPAPNLPAVRRTGLLWLHFICGGAAAFALVDKENPSITFVFGSVRLSGFRMALIVLPAALPYLVSFAISKHAIPTRSLYFWLYAMTLLIGTTVGLWFMTRANSVGSALLILLMQIVAFSIIALSIDEHLRNRRDA
jgi:hypothetical protein